MPEGEGPVRLLPEQPISSTLQAFAAVARRLGVETTAEQMSRSYVFGTVEPADGVIAAIARDLGLEARGIAVAWRDLPRLSKVMPAILKLRGGGALVLEGLRQGAAAEPVALLRDPTAPPDVVAIADEMRLGEVWDGALILVKRRYRLADEARPFGLAWLAAQVLRQRRLFRDIGIAAVIATVFALAPPFAFMIVLNRVITNHSSSTLIVVAAALLILLLFEMAFSHLRRYFTQVATTRIDAHLNLYIFEKLLKLPMGYFERNPTGMIMSKLSEMWRIRAFLTGQLFGVFLDMVPLLGIVPVLFILEWRLALLVVVLALITFVIILFFLKPLGRRYARVVRAEQRRGSHLTESVYGMRTIKSLALEGRRRYEWDRLVAETTEARHELGLLANYPQTLTLPFQRLMYSGPMLLGAALILEKPDAMGLGTLVAFAMLSMRVGLPLIGLAHLQLELGEVRGAVGEVASVMNHPPEESRAGTGLRLPVHGDIIFQDVRYRYAPTAPFALDGVSFRIRAGAIYGIMGRSGSGKTTLTRLLQGLQADYEGIIKIDGMDLREIDLNHLRTSIGVVPQENFLFSGTIRENIAIAKSDAGFAEIVRAAQLAGAEEFIERLPAGYETYLEEGGANLSGGQRQRLAIARALLIDPPVLVLDEATSALDAESEAIINANLLRIARDRTIICISHRLSMLVPSDAIMVMERGKVYDVGRHDELLLRCDIYKQLWHQQNRHIDHTGHANVVAQLRAPVG
jgi:ATP-binding cassette, subfamily B, bacterial HlyB/CyaB